MTTDFNGRPDLAILPGFGAQYVAYTDGYSNLINCLEETKIATEALMNAIPSEKESFAYADGKWSVKSVFLHCIEAERVFQYRAMRFSRFDATPLPGFDEDWYAEHHNSSGRSLAEIAEEFSAVRMSTILLFKGMTTEMLKFEGTMNGFQCTARNLGWMIAGHTMHHCKVVKERYL